MEMLATVGALGILLTVSVAIISPLLLDVRKVKLENAVTSLNQSLDSFEASGGSLASATTAATAVSLLKSSASDQNIIAGYKGSSVDPRLEPLMQDATEAAGSDWRALWNPTDQRFELAQSGADGVKEFVLNESLVSTDFGEHAREVPNKLAVQDNWIWDFDDASVTAQLTPDMINPDDVPDLGGPGTMDDLNQLQPPGFDPPGQFFDFFEFPSQVELTNLNDPSSSEIHYSLNGSSWQVYSSPIPISRGDQLSAFVKTTAGDPDVYNSYTTTELYRSEDPILSGTSEGVFKNVIGANGLVSSIASGDSNGTLQYGESFNGGPQNELTFTGQNFSDINPDEVFTIGQLTYLNSTTGVGTSAYEVTLQLDLNFSSPAGASESVDVVLGLESTKNYPWLTEAQKADYVRFNEINTDFTTFFGGETYYLNLEFVYSGTEGYSAVDSFHVNEGASETADVVGYFSTTPNEPPDTTGGTGGGSTPAPPSIP